MPQDRGQKRVKRCTSRQVAPLAVPAAVAATVSVIATDAIASAPFSCQVSLAITWYSGLMLMAVIGSIVNASCYSTLRHAYTVSGG
eukprot:6198354-Pleurochrysis_carterae.AAC.2